MIVVRYADDFVVGFQRRWEAESFLKELKERLAKFGLDLTPTKPGLLSLEGCESGPEETRAKPETFDFMGMTREIPCRAQAIPALYKEFGKHSECGCTWVGHMKSQNCRIPGTLQTSYLLMRTLRRRSQKDR